MRVTRYSYLLTLNDRKRHEHVTEHGRVIQFVVQYETFEALTFADHDIDENWERYKEAYLRGKRS